MNVARQVQHWRESALDDLEAAALLLENGKVNQGFFFAHLALEKALKALVCRRRQSTPPLIHNLPRLAEIAEIELAPEQQRILAQVTAFHLRGRYDLPARPLISASEAQSLFSSVKELTRWLTNL